MYEYKVIEKPRFKHRIPQIINDKWNQILQGASKQGYEYYFSYTDTEYSHYPITMAITVILLIIFVLITIITTGRLFSISMILSLGILVFCTYAVKPVNYQYFVFRREIKHKPVMPISPSSTTSNPTPEVSVDFQKEEKTFISKEEFLKKYPPTL